MALHVALLAALAGPGSADALAGPATDVTSVQLPVTDADGANESESFEFGARRATTGSTAYVRSGAGYAEVPRGRSGVPAGVAPRGPVTSYERACGAESDLCSGAVSRLCAGQPGTQLFSATTTQPGGTTSPSRLVCRGPGEVPGPGPDAAPTFTLAQVQAAVQEQFESLVPPTAPVAVQPDDGALLHYPAIFYATVPAPPSLRDEGLLLGVLPYRIDAAPARHDWTVDGQRRALADTHQGRPFTEAQRVHLGDGRVSQYYVGWTFDTPGRHSVALSTTWAGTFTVPGFGTSVLPAPVTTTSPTVELDVRGARSQLVR